MFDTIHTAVTNGLMASQIVSIHNPKASRRSIQLIATRSWPIQPAIMTARANLLLIPLCDIMRDRINSPDPDVSWSEFTQTVVDNAQFGYNAAVGNFDALSSRFRAELYDENAALPNIVRDQRRSLIQLRLHYCLLGLPVNLLRYPEESPAIPDCLRPGKLRSEIGALCSWLITENSDGNVITAIDPWAYEYMDAICQRNPDFREWNEVHSTLFWRNGVRSEYVFQEHLRNCRWCSQSGPSA